VWIDNFHLHSRNRLPTDRNHHVLPVSSRSLRLVFQSARRPCNTSTPTHKNSRAISRNRIAKPPRHQQPHALHTWREFFPEQSLPKLSTQLARCSFEGQHAPEHPALGKKPLLPISFSMRSRGSIKNCAPLRGANLPLLVTHSRARGRNSASPGTHHSGSHRKRNQQVRNLAKRRETTAVFRDFGVAFCKRNETSYRSTSKSQISMRDASTPFCRTISFPPRCIQQHTARVRFRRPLALATKKFTEPAAISAPRLPAMPVSGALHSTILSTFAISPMSAPVPPTASSLPLR